MSQQAPGKGVGRIFMIVAWCAGLYLATQFFGRWEQRQQNPNTEVTSQQGEGYIEVKLLGNVQGHFVASGRINNVPVEFLLDTGATDVAVPLDLARQLALPKGLPVTLSTANGRTQGYQTRISPAAGRHCAARCASCSGPRAGRRAGAAGHECAEQT